MIKIDTLRSDSSYGDSPSRKSSRPTINFIDTLVMWRGADTLDKKGPTRDILTKSQMAASKFLRIDLSLVSKKRRTGNNGKKESDSRKNVTENTRPPLGAHKVVPRGTAPAAMSADECYWAHRHSYDHHSTVRAAYKQISEDAAKQMQEWEEMYPTEDAQIKPFEEQFVLEVDVPLAPTGSMSLEELTRRCSEGMISGRSSLQKRYYDQRKLIHRASRVGPV